MNWSDKTVILFAIIGVWHLLIDLVFLFGWIYNWAYNFGRR